MYFFSSTISLKICSFFLRLDLFRAAHKFGKSEKHEFNQYYWIYFNKNLHRESLMSYKWCTLNIFNITAIGFDNTSEMILQLGTPVMHDLFRYIVPCWNQGGFQGSNIAMGFCTSLALKDGLHCKVHDVKIRAGWAPHWFVPKRWKIFETPGLNNIGIVCWSNILGEHI